MPRDFLIISYAAAISCERSVASLIMSSGTPLAMSLSGRYRDEVLSAITELLATGAMRNHSADGPS